MITHQRFGMALSAAAQFLTSAVAGTVVGLLAVGVVANLNLKSAAAIEQSPFYLSGGTLASGCWNWSTDYGLWKDATGDGVLEPFRYWWSGQARFWNNASAHGCWHNDEDTLSGNPARPGADITAGSSTPIHFKTEHWNSFTAWPAVLFENTGCRGVQARVYEPTGLYMSTVEYWHITPVSGVVGTNWTYHFDVPGYGSAYRQIGSGAYCDSTTKSDGYCTTYGYHLHQSAWTGWYSSYPVAGSTANQAADPNGFSSFWLRWGTY